MVVSSERASLKIILNPYPKRWSAKDTQKSNRRSLFVGEHIICYLYLNQSELESTIEDVEGTVTCPQENLL